jgi:hypothetical protein
MKQKFKEHSIKNWSCGELGKRQNGKGNSISQVNAANILGGNQWQLNPTISSWSQNIHKDEANIVFL